MKKSIAYRYLTQKTIGFFEIFAFILILIGLIICWAVFLYAGLGIILFSVVFLVVYKGTKVKDDEFDAALKGILDENNIFLDKPNIIGTYRLDVELVVLGKDGVARSSEFVVLEIKKNKDEIVFFVQKVNIIDNNVDSKEYIIPIKQKIEVISKKINRKGINKTASFLCGSCLDERIPIKIDDEKSYLLIKSIDGLISINM